MSHIIKFSIKELAGRKKEYTRILNEDINIFFGLNGSGKTSLLKILHAAMSMDRDILRNVPFKQANIELSSKKTEETFIFEIKKNLTHIAKERLDLPEILFQENIPEEIKAELEILSQHHHKQEKISVEVNSKEPFRGLRHTYLPVSRPYPTKRPERLPLSEGQLDLLFAKNLQDLWRRYSTEMLSHIRKIQEDGLANILKTVLSAEESNHLNEVMTEKSISEEMAYEQMRNFLNRQNTNIDILGTRDNFIQRYAKDTRLQKVVSDINAVEKEIEHTLLPRQHLQRLIQKMFSHKHIEFTDSDILVKTEDDRALGLHLLSSGERQLMLIFLETFLAGESIILIDEPEMSMHIDWQLELVNAMRQLNPKAQLILATHSPEIMAEVSDDKIFRLNNE
ncbi:AAA family ATPase [Thioflexithrix psekupsensis]|uniref:AAA+ ATPase domain-containing protein n=1 Tax=Thioflexithrix psekupsensis TaxID=1570016 RepID=A0A251XAS5_9GAMM|nr:ATP-binding protein [Thioflexithrix psekupsensis]OUD15403.1 hypothetical protein TPSD3_02420 [Thioflexithrix psekupsensis]